MIERARVAAIVAAIVVTTSTACEITYGIGTVLDPSEHTTPTETASKIDVLVVVDNSPSMATKQSRFLRTLFKPECPIANLSAVPTALQRPALDEREQLAKECGLTQLLAADDRDFRIGFITTDVDACDNLVGQSARTPRSQRGCLQGNGVVKFVSRDDIGFAQTLTLLYDGIGAFGNPYQRAFDAVLAFAHPDALVADACQSDATSFLRDDADLLVIIATDKDDCSHADSVDATLPDAFTSCDVDDDTALNALFGDARSPAHCSSAGALLDVDDVATKLASLKHLPARVAVAIVGGAVSDASGSWRTAGCLLSTNGVPVVACDDADDVFALHSPTTCPLAAPQSCCDAHFAPRLYDVAAHMPSGTGSICAADDAFEVDAAVALAPDPT